MTLRERAAALWKRLRRAVGLNDPGWPCRPRDDAHAYFRTQYERMLPVLKALPRRPRTAEEVGAASQTFLAFSRVLQELHDNGDDPILPPGIRRMVIRENSTRLAALGEVQQPSLLGRMAGILTGPLAPWLFGGVALMLLSGWGLGIFNGFRADFWEGRAQRNRAVAEENYRQWQIQRDRAAARLEALTAAQQLTQAVARDLTAEREARARAAARERRRVREIQNVLTGAPEPPAWRLRDDEPATDGTAGAGNP